MEFYERNVFNCRGTFNAPKRVEYTAPKRCLKRRARLSVRHPELGRWSTESQLETGFKPETS